MTKKIEDYVSPGDTIIVEAKAVKEMEGLIHIPSDAIDKSFFEVLSLGKTFESTDIKIGDTILVNGKGGDRVDIGFGTYWVYPTKMVASKIIDDEVHPLGKFCTLEFQKFDDHKESGGIIVDSNETVRYLKVIRVGDKCNDLVPGDIAVIEEDKLILVDTHNNKVFLTSEQAVIAKVE